MPSVASRDPDDLLARGWQPIKTAPKRGKHRYEEGPQILGYFARGAYGDIDSPDMLIIWWNAGAWDYHGDLMSGGLKPTHWMPLPEPPDA